MYHIKWKLICKYFFLHSWEISISEFLNKTNWIRNLPPICLFVSSESHNALKISICIPIYISNIHSRISSHVPLYCNLNAYYFVYTRFVIILSYNVVLCCFYSKHVTVFVHSKTTVSVFEFSLFHIQIIVIWSYLQVPFQSLIIQRRF